MLSVQQIPSDLVPLVRQCSCQIDQQWVVRPFRFLLISVVKKVRSTASVHLFVESLQQEGYYTGTGGLR